MPTRASHIAKIYVFVHIVDWLFFFYLHTYLERFDLTSNKNPHDKTTKNDKNIKIAIFYIMDL